MEAMEALLFGCMACVPRREHRRLLRTVHYQLLPQVTGYRRVRGTYQQLSYARPSREPVGEVLKLSSGNDNCCSREPWLADRTDGYRNDRHPEQSWGEDPGQGCPG